MESFTLIAFAVKHLAYHRGPLASIMKQIIEQPYALTSKRPEARRSIGKYVYVIEVRREQFKATYWLGYSFLVSDVVRPAGGGLWDDEFELKLISSYPAKGKFLEPQIQITAPLACEWLTTKQPGMAQIPSSVVPLIDAPLSHYGSSF